MPDSIHPLHLTGVLKSYAWGKPASESLLSFLVPPGSISDDTLCAELWFGAHPSGPSLVDGKEDLRSLLATHGQRYLGSRVYERFGSELPFLFKVLSIAKPLSIQAHPDKELALILHKKDPKNYPDTNHKPEIAIALSDVRMLMGFRSFSQIALDLSKFPSFVMPLSKAESQDSSVRELLSWLLGMKDSERGSLVQEIRNKLSLVDRLSEYEILALNLASQFGEEDPGVLVSFLLNLVKLEQGQAIFTPPNTPHAYLSGTLVECMATSDNVVRGGLTKKFVDRTILLEMLDYKPLTVSALKRQFLDDSRIRFSLPVDEFTMEDIETDESLEISAIDQDGPHLIFCLRGEGSIEYLSGAVQLRRGSAFLVPASLRPYTLSMKRGRVFRVSVP